MALNDYRILNVEKQKKKFYEHLEQILHSGSHFSCGHLAFSLESQKKEKTKKN